MKTNLSCGIDVGSTTVKAVVLDSSNTILWKKYQRHNTQQAKLVLEFLKLIRKEFPDDTIHLYITGSGGRVIAPEIHANYIQEVNAVTYAVEHFHPHTSSVVELGGQDAKVIFWKEDEQGNKTTLTSMNDKCAGGTGATIDKIMSKIGLSTDEAAQLRYTGQTIHQIAAKCGVFAETDVVGLLKAGVDKSEIFISLCAAVVQQNLEVLVRGNILKSKVLLLGGPHTFLPVIGDLWKKYIPESWETHQWVPPEASIEDLVFSPPNAEYFASIGAVLFGNQEEALVRKLQTVLHEHENTLKDTDQFERYVSGSRSRQLEASGMVREGLVSSAEELRIFREKHTIPEFVPVEYPPSTEVECYLGIDGGSTSSKMALIDPEGNLIYKDYVLSHGNPIVDIQNMFSALLKWQEEKRINYSVKKAAVTGYASELLARAFSLDLSIVETIAHMRSAVYHYGETDIICDIGGQDIKIIFLKNQRVVDFKLNTQCSAGNGFFLQGMAEQFQIPVERYAEYAFKAAKAPKFNYGCAVFMEQDKVHFQQLGWSKEEIMAGLALVLPLNIWNYVVQDTNISKYGNRIILQGGTQKNLAAVKAQVDYIRSKSPEAEVIVHKHADISGAIGAAIEVMESDKNESTTFPGFGEAVNIEFTSTNDASTRCTFCTNNCPRTFIDISHGDRHIPRFVTGYGCPKGMNGSLEEMKKQQAQIDAIKTETPNLVDHAAKEVFAQRTFLPMPENRSLVSWSRFSARELRKKGFGRGKSLFQGSSPEILNNRKNLTIGIPSLLNQYVYSPFFSTYFRALGVGDVIHSGFTTAKLWKEGNMWGANDPCFPAKAAPAHIYSLLKNPKVTHICFPRVTHLETDLDNTLGNNACVIQMGTPEVVEAVFTKDKDFFKEYGKVYWKPLVNLDRPREAEHMLFCYFGELLNLTEDENTWAVEQAYASMDSYLQDLQNRGRNVLSRLAEEDRMGVLLIGHPYHHDPGLNHGILEEFQLHGYPILPIESLPRDPEYLNHLFGTDSSRHFDISNVWKRNFNRNLNHKIWAARFASKHPNLAVIDLSSFKCGFDAPAYSYIDNILEASGTPHFLFHDIDQNKPGATFNIRIKTIDYFLKLEESNLKKRVSRIA